MFLIVFSKFFIYYLRHRLVSREGIASLGVRPSRCVCVRRISVGGEGNALCPVLSSLQDVPMKPGLFLQTYSFLN